MRVLYLFLIVILSFILPIIHSFIPDISSISNHQILINQINSTHFSCDNNKKIFSLEKFNDDFCDCEDGSDENKTNACSNGFYYCKNKFYFPKVVPTSQLNDGICDCCDGSDEFLNNKCDNYCLYYSDKEYTKLLNDFNNINNMLNEYPEDSTIEYFDEILNYINEINETYNMLKKLYDDKVLIERYLYSNSTEKDDSIISERDLKKILQNIDEKIKQNKDSLFEEEDNIYSLIKIKNFNELIGDKKVNLKLNEYECQLNKNKFSCNSNISPQSSQKSRSYGNLNFGQLSFIRNNKGVFLNGHDCDGYPGVSLTAEINFKCGKKDFFELVKVENNCFYSFNFYNYLACNNDGLKNIIDEINILINKN